MSGVASRDALLEMQEARVKWRFPVVYRRGVRPSAAFGTHPSSFGWLSTSDGKKGDCVEDLLL